MIVRTLHGVTCRGPSKGRKNRCCERKKSLNGLRIHVQLVYVCSVTAGCYGGGIIVIYTDRLLLFSQPPHRHHYSYVFSALFKSEPVHCRSLATKIPICSHSDDRLHTATIHKHAAHTNTRRDVYEKVFGEKNSTPPAHPFTPRSLFTDNSPPSPYHSPLDLN